MDLYVAALWRYPVKSMAGERLAEVELRADGLRGDRLVQVVDAATGRVVTSRTKPRLLALGGALGEDGEVRVDGRPWRAEAVAADVRRAAGLTAHLVRNEELDRFDILPLSIATDGAAAVFGRDVRRLRPNLVIGGVDGLAERAWQGRRLRIGGALIQIRELRQRCVMTTYDPDTQVQDIDVLRDIVRRFGGKLSLDAEVIVPGTLREGAPVELLP